MSIVTYTTDLDRLTQTNQTNKIHTHNRLYDSSKCVLSHMCIISGLKSQSNKFWWTDRTYFHIQFFFFCFFAFFLFDDFTRFLDFPFAICYVSFFFYFVRSSIVVLIISIWNFSRQYYCVRFMHQPFQFENSFEWIKIMSFQLPQHSFAYMHFLYTYSVSVSVCSRKFLSLHCI